MHELRYQNENKLDAAAVKCCEMVLQILEDCTVHVLPPPEVSVLGFLSVGCIYYIFMKYLPIRING